MKEKLLNIMFFVVTLNGLLIGVYHLYLPTYWQWEKGLTETPEILRWALLTLNDMWSILIILLHGVLLVCFKRGLEVKRYQLGFFMAAYWAFHAAIISINPIPMPQQLQWLLGVLTAIPCLQSLTLAAGALNIRSKQVKQVKQVNNQYFDRGTEQLIPKRNK
jgi:hypothetical protein